MKGKAALVIGASRGIGRQIALTLSKHGYGVGVAARTLEDTPKTPGTVLSVAREIETHGGTAIPIKCDVRVPAEIDGAVDLCIDKFGQLDCLIYNSGAILWKPVSETPLSRYDLMMEVNARGSYAAVQKVLPYFLEQNAGRIILVAPPIYNRFFKGKTPYAMSKVAMTVLTHGLANELKDTGVTVSALWPATVISSHVTDIKGAPPAIMRKPTIFADACMRIIEEHSEKYNGRALLDEDLLRKAGVTDFRRYRCDPDVEPLRMMPKMLPSLLVEEEDESHDWQFKITNKKSKR